MTVSAQAQARPAPATHGRTMAYQFLRSTKVLGSRGRPAGYAAASRRADHNSTGPTTWSMMQHRPPSSRSICRRRSPMRSLTLSFDAARYFSIFFSVAAIQSEVDVQVR